MGAPLPQGEQKAVAVRAMFDRIAPRYDLVNRIMTFRLDVGWRRKTVGALLLQRGSSVLDLACGTGDLCRELDAAGYHSIGVDFSYGMLAASRTAAPRIQADVLRLPVRDSSVDGVTCGFALRNLVDLHAFFEEVARVVRPGGRIAMLEVSQPRTRLLRWGHEVYFGKVVPKIGGLLSDRPAYEYLPRSVVYLPPPPELLDMIADAGFGTVQRLELSAGIAQLLVATRVGGPS